VNVAMIALRGDQVEEAAACQIDGAEDAAPPIDTRGHDLLPLAVGDPGGAHPGQQG
jgi:hypothetical protein